MHLVHCRESTLLLSTLSSQISCSEEDALKRVHHEALERWDIVEAGVESQDQRRHMPVSCFFGWTESACTEAHCGANELALLYSCRWCSEGTTLTIRL